MLPTLTPLPPTLTPSPTDTVIWFPPTSTQTPFPTALPATPTEDQSPGIGELIYRDDFSDPQAWSLGEKENARSSFGKNELTIAINGVKTYLFSLRSEPVLTDFYAEITASPTFCQGKDEYGLLLRASSEASYYRFSLSCAGQVRLDRIYQGEASSPQPWMISGAVPLGGPSSSRLGVWAVGQEMRFFVNDQYQFGVRDPLIPAGGLGVFARSTSDMPLTVNFSALEVREVIP